MSRHPAPPEKKHSSATPSSFPPSSISNCGNVFILRNAGHPADLPLLHRRQRRLGHRQNPRKRHCRRIQRQRVPVHHFGGVVCRPSMGCGKTLFLSGIVVMLGHIVLAAAPGLYGLLIGLIFIALGSGGVKSTASSMVGALYEQDEMRPLRDAGFSIFYIAINIGGFLGPLLTDLLQENIGFHYGFGAAAVGMAFGLWRYSLGRKNLPHPIVPIRFQKDRAKLRPPSALLSSPHLQPPSKPGLSTSTISPASSYLPSSLPSLPILPAC